MEYKGYIGRVEYDADGDTLHGEVVGTRDVITFEGRSVEELHQALKDSVDVYLEVCKEAGKSPDRPFSGRFIARIDPELHRAIATRAAVSGMSLNAWVAAVFREAVGKPSNETLGVEEPKNSRTTRAKRAASRKRKHQPQPR
jgi:predicted HicB family RNase H-like nuclease